MKERRLRFCIGAKLCSRKSKSEREAREICSRPKEPKTKGAKAGKQKSCEAEMLELVTCIMDKIDSKLASNINSLGRAIADAMIECRCQSED